MDSRDIGAKSAEFFDDAFVAAVDVVDALDRGLAGSDEGRQDEAGAGAQVGSLDRSAGKMRGATDDRVMTIDRDVGAHAFHFQGVKEAVFENRLGNFASALG